MTPTIQTNLHSMAAQRALHRSTQSVGDTYRNLASGKRVNSAKDDASGMAVATRLTSQVRAYDQSVRNVNDGISVLQIASGALDETRNALQRIRDLTLQASNGSLTLSDRKDIQLEINGLLAEINRISSDTEYNGMPILNGSFAGKDAVPETPATEATEEQPAVEGVQAILRYVGFDPATGDPLGNYNPTGEASTLFDLVTDGDGSKYVQKEPSADISDAFNYEPGNGFYVLEVAGVTPRDAIPTQDAQDAIPGSPEEPGMRLHLGQGTNQNVGLRIPQVDASTLLLKPFDNSSEWVDVPPSTVVDSAIQSDPSITWPPNPVVDVTAPMYPELTLSPDEQATKTYTQIEPTAENYPGKTLPPVDVNGNPSLGYEDYIYDAAQDKYIFVNGLGDYRLTGTESALDETGQISAIHSLTRIDAALEEVTDLIATLGSMESRLASAQVNLATAHEQTSASLSRLVDTDVAESSATLTKNSIIQQASTAILAQANQYPALMATLLQDV